MAPDLSEKLLGIDIDGADDQRRQDAGDSEEEQEELERFVFFKSGSNRLAVSVDAVRTLAELPEELTRVPRTPPAIEGMVDLRGEVTAVIDPTVHFPTDDSETQRGRERLLVLDRPSDQQSAAIRVDDVIGVETVPVSNVLDEATVEDRPFSSDPLTHPLVDALIEQEHEHEADDDGIVATTESGVESSSAAGTATQAGVGMTSSPLGSSHANSSDDTGTPFSLDADETATDSSDETEAPRELVIEVTPLVDIETLLLASGRRDQQP
ncbi:chemotaxis protein CheW [Natronorubrum bangense]|uniref:Chemotaxis protein CheW n=2 Tax=Natronorubrum bangense TaxID=61858 RepID=L9WDX7_9EURY|nr:chemotaxis protein CheW [Natronorubrum bangense]ELY47710.1 chemotaxis protein CheW [Natronorubrum bangense JCM 10635]QCC53498.1 chemotaxis protein CheW [Natronorubrum bangense]